MTKQRTKTELRQGARQALNELLTDIKRRVDEFDSFLDEAVEDYRERFEDEDDLDGRTAVEAVGPYYDGRDMDLGNILEDFRDDVLNFERRLGKVKVRNAR